MARQPTPRQLYERLLELYGEKIADAFMRAIKDLISGADLQRMIAAVERRDLEGAIRALNLEQAAYEPVLEAVREAYIENGNATANLLPRRTPDGAALIFRFNARNHRAEQWLRDHGAEMARQLVDDQRTAVRNALVAGMEAGRNPRSVALEIVGRVDRRTGERVGGLIGLTSSQEEYVRNARSELQSGDPEQLRAYLGRARRDKRFDRAVLAAIRDEKPLAADLIERATTAYTSRLKELRGQVLGRTEALTALNASQYEALRQAVDTGALQESQIRRVWRSAADLRVRDTHRALSGETVGLNEAFRSPSGALLRFPGDPQAPMSERVQCRCWIQPRVDWSANVR